MPILLTADDFGFDDDTVSATIECLESGSVTNASFMANMPATARAGAYAVANPQYCYGVHLTLTRDSVESPVLGPDAVPGLVDDDGLFLTGRDAQLRAIRGGYPGEQIRAEMIAQIAQIRDLGVPLDYVDSHKHLHKFPVFSRELPAILDAFDIKTVRRMQTHWEGSAGLKPTVWLNRIWRERITNRFVTSDHFFMADGTEDQSWWDTVPLDLPGSLEVGAHPGFTQPWRINEKRGLDALRDRMATQGLTPARWRDLTAP